jgi:tight adherence protein B
MSPLVVKLATFVAGVFAFVGVFSILSDLILKDRARVKDRLEEAFGGERQRRERKSALFRDLQLFHADTSKRVPVLWKRFVMAVERSGLPTSPSTILRISLTASIIGGIVGATVVRLWFVAALLATIGLVAPFIYVYAARAARIHSLCMQLPEAFDLMSRAIRAGQTVNGAMQLVGEQLKPPLSIEFASCCEQQNLGLPFDVALQELARRTGVVELQMFVAALLVHRSTGGNLGEILDGLSEIIRKRSRMRAKVKAATSEGRLQALVLSLLPLGTLVGLMIVNRPYAQILIDRPALIGGILASEAIGTLWIRKIVNVDF